MRTCSHVRMDVLKIYADALCTQSHILYLFSAPFLTGLPHEIYIIFWGVKN
jgi:hypothetical protein